MTIDPAATRTERFKTAIEEVVRLATKNTDLEGHRFEWFFSQSGAVYSVEYIDHLDGKRFGLRGESESAVMESLLFNAIGRAAKKLLCPKLDGTVESLAEACAPLS